MYSSSPEHFIAKNTGELGGMGSLPGGGEGDLL